MQNRYVGDVGDFAKYGLLRTLTRETARRLGVVWYLVDDEKHNADGRHVGYLRDPSFIRLDPVLHSTLERLVSTNRRSIRAVERAAILPPGTAFFRAAVSCQPAKLVPRQERARRRAAWLRRALAATANSEIVFFDPDNGLETASVQRHAPKSGKYVFWEELVPFWERGQSLVIYHHLNRTATVARQADILKERFAVRFPDAALTFFFLWRRGSCRHFWLVGQKAHAEELKRATNAVVQSDWREYFELG
jgi:hypothetical protein